MTTYNTRLYKVQCVGESVTRAICQSGLESCSAVAPESGEPVIK